jgi:hypothetical protein
MVAKLATGVVQPNKLRGVILNEEGARDQCVDRPGRKCRRVVTHAAVSGPDWTTNSMNVMRVEKRMVKGD